MAKFLFIAVLIFLTIFLLWVIITHFSTQKRIINAFRVGSVIVYGPKGYGKDVLFQDVIKKRNEVYFGNYNYGYSYNHFNMKELELADNDFKNFINGNVLPVKKNEAFEGHDFYIGDAGIYLPSQFDALLHKIYPSLPITYALSRHLYNNAIHMNSQQLERPWKALREQADYFILMRKRRLNLPFFIVIFTREYEKYSSAKEGLAPMKGRFFNKFSKAELDQYKAKNGFIKDGFIIVRKSIIKYDTRAFHEIIFKDKAPRKEIGIWLKLKKFWNKIYKNSKTMSNKTRKTKSKC